MKVIDAEFGMRVITNLLGGFPFGRSSLYSGRNSFNNHCKCLTQSADQKNGPSLPMFPKDGAVDIAWSNLMNVWNEREFEFQNSL